jgi:putative polyhydroxyalkanoate system protein
MADIHIVREHQLGLAAARTLAYAWAKQAQDEFGMECSMEEGVDADILRFSRSGVSGVLQTGPKDFELTAKLGFLLGAFKQKIEAEIEKNLDKLLAQP